MTPELKVKRILFATDFLQSSRLALDYAVAFARHFKATIVMLHAVELPYTAREAETATRRPSISRRQLMDRLEAVAAGVRCRGIVVETFLEDGVPNEVILRAIDSHEADLLVMGIQGVHRGISHLLIGSNAEKILLGATCPTMTVGAHVPTGVDPNLHFNEILYFSDFTPEAAEAAPYASFLAKEFNAPIDICQLLPEVAETNLRLQHDLADEYCKAMRDVFPRSDADWVKPSFQLERGMEFDQIIERAEVQQAGLIVLGVRTPSHLGRHLHTSFAYQLLSRASCPVLSVRQRSLSPGLN